MGKDTMILGPDKPRWLGLLLKTLIGAGGVAVSALACWVGALLIQISSFMPVQLESNAKLETDVQRLYRLDTYDEEEEQKLMRELDVANRVNLELIRILGPSLKSSKIELPASSDHDEDEVEGKHYEKDMLHMQRTVPPPAPR